MCIFININYNHIITKKIFLYFYKYILLKQLYKLFLKLELEKMNEEKIFFFLYLLFCILIYLIVICLVVHFTQK